jgi:hypothetical protein
VVGSDLAVKGAEIVVQQGRKVGIQEFTPWQDDQVEHLGRLVVSKELPYPPL